MVCNERSVILSRDYIWRNGTSNNLIFDEPTLSARMYKDIGKSH